MVITNAFPSAMAARRISSVLLSGVMNNSGDRDQAGRARTRSTHRSLPSKSAMNEEKSQWNRESGRATAPKPAHTFSRISRCSPAASSPAASRGGTTPLSRGSATLMVCVGVMIQSAARSPGDGTSPVSAS